jgi:hypothetical protein
MQDDNILYAVTCSECHVIYDSDTKPTILTRLKQLLYTIHVGTLNTHIVQHFQTHPITSLFITGLEVKACWADRQRKEAEQRWRAKLKTLPPLGLNIREWGPHWDAAGGAGGSWDSSWGVPCMASGRLCVLICYTFLSLLLLPSHHDLLRPSTSFTLPFILLEASFM